MSDAESLFNFVLHWLWPGVEVRAIALIRFDLLMCDLMMPLIRPIFYWVSRIRIRPKRMISPFCQISESTYGNIDFDYVRMRHRKMSKWLKCKNIYSRNRFFPINLLKRNSSLIFLQRNSQTDRILVYHRLPSFIRSQIRAAAEIKTPSASDSNLEFLFFSFASVPFVD